MKFSELVRLLEKNGFHLLKEKGSIRYYVKPGHERLIRVDFHGARRSQQVLVMLSLRQPASRKGANRND